MHDDQPATYRESGNVPHHSRMQTAEEKGRAFAWPFS